MNASLAPHPPLVYPLVLASHSAGKLKEFQQFFNDLAPQATANVPRIHWQLRAQSELGISEAPEPYHSFVENALTKARHAASNTQLPALADDSGLCVAALNDAPGVLSRRYSAAATDSANNEKLLQQLATIPDRRAYFYCVLVFVRWADDPTPLIATGRWSGEILHAPQGSTGFGYDPLFYCPALKKSAAQLTVVEKNQTSHRARALLQLAPQLESLVLAPMNKMNPRAQ